MRKKFDDIKKDIATSQKLQKKFDETISEEPQIVMTLNGKPLKSLMTENAIEAMQSYLDYLTYIDTLAQMSPTIWWKDKYVKELQSLRKESREILKKLRENI